MSACAHPARLRPISPPAADLAVPAKPVPTVEILTSAQASAEYNSALEAWGDGMAAQLGRLCRWAATNGVRGLDCPRPPTVGAPAS